MKNLGFDLRPRIDPDNTFLESNTLIISKDSDDKSKTPGYDDGKESVDVQIHILDMYRDKKLGSLKELNIDNGNLEDGYSKYIRDFKDSVLNKNQSEKADEKKIPKTKSKYSKRDQNLYNILPKRAQKIVPNHKLRSPVPYPGSNSRGYTPGISTFEDEYSKKFAPYGNRDNDSNSHHGNTENYQISTFNRRNMKETDSIKSKSKNTNQRLRINQKKGSKRMESHKNSIFNLRPQRYNHLDSCESDFINEYNHRSRIETTNYDYPQDQKYAPPRKLNLNNFSESQNRQARLSVLDKNSSSRKYDTRTMKSTMNNSRSPKFYNKKSRDPDRRFSLRPHWVQSRGRNPDRDHALKHFDSKFNSNKNNYNEERRRNAQDLNLIREQYNLRFGKPSYDINGPQKPYKVQQSNTPFQSEYFLKPYNIRSSKTVYDQKQLINPFKNSYEQRGSDGNHTSRRHVKTPIYHDFDSLEQLNSQHNSKNPCYGSPIDHKKEYNERYESKNKLNNFDHQGLPQYRDYCVSENGQYIEKFDNKPMVKVRYVKMGKDSDNQIENPLYSPDYHFSELPKAKRFHHELSPEHLRSSSHHSPYFLKFPLDPEAQLLRRHAMLLLDCIEKMREEMRIKNGLDDDEWDEILWFY